MYKHIAKSYNSLHGQEQTRKLQLLLQHADLPTSGCVADIGCGTAHLAKFFENYTYIGVDPCQELLDEAPSNVKTVCAHGEYLPLPDDSQDIVLSLTALHNYDNPEQGVQEISRIAKNIVLIGVLKKSENHDKIIRQLKDTFFTEKEIDDQHDTLLILRSKKQ